MEPMCHQHSNKEADEHCISFRQKPVPTTNTHLIRHTNTHTTQTNINIPSASPLSRDTAAVIVEVVWRKGWSCGRASQKWHTLRMRGGQGASVEEEFLKMLVGEKFLSAPTCAGWTQNVVFQPASYNWNWLSRVLPWLKRSVLHLCHHSGELSVPLRQSTWCSGKEVSS